MTDTFFPTVIDLSGSAVTEIHTSVSNPRVIFDSKGVRATDSGGGILFNLDATTGNITATGLTINGSQIAAGTITATQIANGTITSLQIANGTITATQIAGNTITAGQIANGTITATQIAGGTITSVQIANNTITATQIANGTIGTAQIANGAVTTSLLAAGSVTSTTIANNTITATNIANGVITSTQISATAGIVGTQIANGTITTTQIAANTIVAGNIAASTITGTQIAASTIDATKINVATLSAITANAGTITAGTITGATVQNVSSDPRVAFDSTGFFITDATPVHVVQLDSGNGLRFKAGSSAINSVSWHLNSATGTQVGVVDTTGTGTQSNLQLGSQVGGVISNIQVLADSTADSANQIKTSVTNAAASLNWGRIIIDGSGQSHFLQLGQNQLKRNIALAADTITLTAQNINTKTITHGLKDANGNNVTPIIVLGNSAPGVNPPVVMLFDTITSTSFKATAQSGTNTNISGTFPFYWLAIG